jgi:hypothetical protein
MGENRLEAFTEAERDGSSVRLPWGALVLILIVLAVVVAAVFSRPWPASSDIRIRNDSQFSLHRVIVNGQSYGNIDAGMASDYRTMRVAYRYGSVRLNMGTKEIQLTPDDYVGESPLGNGKFTYVLNIVDGKTIVIKAEKDAQ